ncbi:hypothetical protein OSB04_002541 [Centaurea solstitialis]|uniref:Zinc knuckle CX2CX4HX4C domain-containing protein n=1 Tax=Centaurea solstitialis TaxID=347529 RepID=A0AA38U4W6_9ASTR|nr:hypothetical protein OSB04_002541 [Centaurea solstitialis]
MDACTSSMCDKAWGRPGFAKILLDVWAVGELKRELQIVIPSLSGGDDTTVVLKVEYLWEPIQCSHCLVFGHRTNMCAKAAIVKKDKRKAPLVDDDGFQKVVKKKWIHMEAKDRLDVSSECPVNVVQGIDAHGWSGSGTKSAPISVPNYVRLTRGSPDPPFRQSVVNSYRNYTAKRGVFIPVKSNMPISDASVFREILQSNAFAALANMHDEGLTGSGSAGSTLGEHHGKPPNLSK